jgi:hypothetical protein
VGRHRAGIQTYASPDTARFKTWEVAGTSHVDKHLRASREPLELRDLGVSSEAGARADLRRHVDRHQRADAST